VQGVAGLPHVYDRLCPNPTANSAAPEKDIFIYLPQTHHPKRDHRKKKKAMTLCFNFFIILKITHHLY
jgi:hypothetical protein